MSNPGGGGRSQRTVLDRLLQCSISKLRESGISVIRRDVLFQWHRRELRD